MKKRLIVVAILLIVITTFATVLALADVADFEIESQIVDTKTLCLSQYKSNTSIKNDNAKMLTDLYSEAAKITDEYDAVEFDMVSQYAKLYTNRQNLAEKSDATADNIKITAINTNTLSETLYEKQVYLIFLSILEQEYSDSIIWTDYSYNSKYSRLPFFKLFVCTEYESLGYETVKDLYDAYKRGECEAPENACYVWFDCAKITKVSDPQTNLLDDLGDTDAKQQQDIFRTGALP